jgi:PST family polysaccharide transporter
VTVYFYPKLAVAADKFETKKVFWSFYKNILPLFILGLLLIYCSRTLLVKLLFTKEFLPVTDLFFWQLLGDVLKVASLILGFQFFAKKMTLAFIVSELASLGVLYVASIYLIKFFGIQGVVMAQAFENGIYLLMLIIYFRKSLF